MHLVQLTASGLPPSEHNFCHYLVADPQMNEAEAYTKVSPGISRKSATRQAGRFLAKPEVREYIAKLLEERQKRMQMDEDWVIGRLRDIHDRCMQSVPVYGRDGSAQDDDDPERVPEPMYYKFDASGATKALELIGKHMKMFSDKTDGGGISVGIQINLGHDADGNQKPVIEGTLSRDGTKG